MDDFIKYMNTKAEISYYLEESFMIKKFTDSEFKEDLFFVKGRGELMIDLAKHIENKEDIPVINSSKGIWLAMHRFLNTVLLRKHGIKVPEFSFVPIDNPPPFQNYIIKNIIDQKNYAFTPTLEKIGGNIQVKDERALNEASKTNEGYNYYYYQEFIKSKWEYKIYGVGEKLFFYKQLPVLVNPNKMETRQPIEIISELKEAVLRAMRILDLKIVSVDFLKSEEGIFYLTDINSTPNFNYMKEGYKIVADFLIQEARK